MSFLKRLNCRQLSSLYKAHVHKSHITSTTSASKQPRAVQLDSVQSNSPLHFYQNKVIDEYATQPVNPSTLRQFIFFGRQMTTERLITSANWVRNELLIRLAHRIRDFQQLPFIVGTNPHVEQVYKIYWNSFEAIRQFPLVVTEQDNLEFCKLLTDLLEGGLLALPKLAQGLGESACYYPPEENSLDLFLNRTLRSRISRRVLSEQHLALTEACEEDEWDASLDHGYVGIIFVHCSARQIVNRAKSLAYQHIERYQKNSKSKVLVAPEIEVAIRSGDLDNSNEIVFAYVPEQLEHVLYELLDNAIRFTMKKYPQGNYPSIKVTVSANDSDVYFRISDQGGGMTKSRYERLWSYQARAKEGDFNHFKGVERIPAAIDERASQASKMGTRHLGIGLTMSRIYAEYWGGELQIISMDGHGTDVYVRIPRLGTSIENLGIDLQAHPAFHNTDDSQLILKSTEYKPKDDNKKLALQSDSSQVVLKGQKQLLDTSLTSKSFKGSNWSESSMVQS